MQRTRTFRQQPGGYALLLAAGIGVFLLISGLNGRALPFPHGSAYSDAATSHWPDALFFQRTLRAGYVPLWRPLIMSGQPFAANPLNKVWYPPQWLVIFLPPTVALNLLLWLHLTLAGVGMRAFARQIGLSVDIAALMGIAFALTPRLIADAGAGHLDVVDAIAWFPWIFWAVARLTQTSSDNVNNVRNVVALASFAALCFLADVRTSAFVFALAAAYAIWRWDRRTQTAARLVLAVFLTIALTTVQWLPLLIILPTLSRAGLTSTDAGIFSLQAAQWIGLILSDRGGSNETLLYAGIGVLALAGVGLLSAPRKHWLWGVAVLLSGLYALGANGIIWPLLIRLIPSLLWLRVPPRSWIVGVFALIVLTGYGLQSLSAVTQQATQRTQWLQLRRVIMCYTALLIGLGAACALIGFAYRPTAALIAFGLLIASGAALISGRRVPLGAWALLIVIDLLIMDSTLIEGRDQTDWLDRYTPLAQTLIAAHAERVYSPSYSLPQAVAAYWNIDTFSGVDPFQFAEYVAIVEQATSVRANGYSVTLPALDGDPATINRTAAIDAGLLAQWHVSHVVSAFPINNTDLRLLNVVDQVYVYANQRYQPDPGVVWNNPGSVSVSAAYATDRGMVGVLPSLNGWQRIMSPDATQSVRYTYAPPEQIVGIGISVAALISIGGVLILIRRTTRRQRAV